MYTDLDLRLEQKHPITGDIARLTATAAVKNSVRNLVLTKVKSIPFNRSKGSSISELIGELNTSVLKYEIKSEIEFVITQFEPRVNLGDVEIIQSENSISINIIYKISTLSGDNQFELNLTLNR